MIAYDFANAALVIGRALAVRKNPRATAAERQEMQAAVRDLLEAIGDAHETDYLLDIDLKQCRDFLTELGEDQAKLAGEVYDYCARNNIHVILLERS